MPERAESAAFKGFWQAKVFWRVVAGTPLPISNLRKNAKFPSLIGND
jgi:hypothetical protein